MPPGIIISRMPRPKRREKENCGVFRAIPRFALVRGKRWNIQKVHEMLRSVKIEKHFHFLRLSQRLLA